ncbi:Ig-like domain-containing protein [bacterium]|nr:Ig-like domain-containing protein [bacterium]
MFSFIRNSKVKGILTLWAVLAAVALFTVLACGGGGGDKPQDPTVTSTTPTDGATDIMLNTDITITFSEAMNRTSVMDSLLISPDPGSVASTWSGSTLTINPDSTLADSTTYTVTVGASVQDAEGSSMGSPYSFDFTTDEIPIVASTVPVDNATEISIGINVTINFSKAMSTSNVEANVTVSPDPGTELFNWLVGDTQMVLSYAAALQEDQVYTVTVGANSQDAEGTAMGTLYSFDFTTEDIPTVTGKTPADTATDVLLDTNITITFSEAMNKVSVMDSLTISPSLSSFASTWSGSTLTINPDSALADSTTYTVTVGGSSLDAEGTAMGTGDSFTFTTGAATGALVSGTILDDLESSHDDDLTGAYVLLMNGPPWEASFAYSLNTDASGTYQFDFVQSGSYYPAALVDSNTEDWGPDPFFGDAIGEWPSSPGTALTVTGTDRTSIDITLVDPEAISGQVFYSGIYSSQIFSPSQDVMKLLQVYAYEATTGVMYEAEVTMASSQGPSPDPLYPVAENYDGEWFYGLNPYLIPELSVSGNFADDTVTQTADEYIPPGSYQVLGYLDFPAYEFTQDPVLAGFADNLAAIDNTGDDAGGIDITLYDTIEVQGDVLQVGLGGDVAYTTATVTLLGWPLFAPISNEVIGSDSSAWTYPAAPLGLSVAFHSEPDPADASSLMAVNKQYVLIEHADFDFLGELRVMERATMNTIAAWAGTTINPARAQIIGNVLGAYSATLDDDLGLVGATATISTGDQAVYFYSDLSIGAPYTQLTKPQFAFINVDPPPDEKAIITFSHPDSSIVIDSVTVPVRADELTMFMHFDVSDPGELGSGVTISGSVEDAAHALVGPGVTMTLTHEDGTVLETTLTDASSEYAFNNVPSLMPVYLTGSKTGYVPLSISVFPAHTTPIAGEFPIDSFLLFSESMALGLTSLIPGINEPSWNSTMQSNSWFLLEALDSSSNWDEIAGVTFSTSAPGALIYYWDDAADMYTSIGPTRGYSTNEMGVQAIGYAPSSSAGLFSFNSTGTVVDSVNVVLTPGEMLLWYIEQ